MSKLVNSIRGLIDKYEKERLENITVSNSSIKPLYDRIENIIKPLNVLVRHPHIYMHQASGSGNLTKTPILYFFDDRETRTATNGVYVALIMYSDPVSEKYGSFRLALTQGIEQAKKQALSDDELVSNLTDKSKSVSKEYCSTLLSIGFKISSQSNLTSDASIAEKYYNDKSKITDNILIEDLQKLLSVYSEYINTKLLADEPTSRDGKIYREIVARRGQKEFRELLFKKYNNCIVTGSSVVSVLEAAHIIPYSKNADYSIENGLLLRADIHTLYDLNLIGIDREGIVHVSSKIINSEYYDYNKNIAITYISELLEHKLSKRYEEFLKAQ